MTGSPRYFDLLHYYLCGFINVIVFQAFSLTKVFKRLNGFVLPKVILITLVYWSHLESIPGVNFPSRSIINYQLNFAHLVFLLFHNMSSVLHMYPLSIFHLAKWSLMYLMDSFYSFPTLFVKFLILQGSPFYFDPSFKLKTFLKLMHSIACRDIY